MIIVISFGTVSDKWTTVSLRIVKVKAFEKFVHSIGITVLVFMCLSE